MYHFDDPDGCEKVADHWPARTDEFHWVHSAPANFPHSLAATSTIRENIDDSRKRNKECTLLKYKNLL